MAEGPPDIDGKYFFEVFLTLPGDGDGKKIGDFGPYDTEDEAKRALREKCRDMCEFIEEKFGGGKSGQYLDMKTNEFRKWDEN